MHEKNTSTILFAGGGSGGHLFPGIAVAEELLQRDPRRHIIFVGSDKPLEKSIIQDAGFRHVAVSVRPPMLARRRPIQFLRDNFSALRETKSLMNELKPSVVIGLGGFASALALRLASWSHIPTLLLEQNAIPGRVTRWHQQRATLICTTFEESVTHLSRTDRVLVTGNPLRRSIRGIDVAHDNANKTLLVLGGSQGAHAINRAMMEVAAQLSRTLSDWRIIHQTGKEDADEVRSAYTRLQIDHRVEPFFSNMHELLGTATLAVSRSGATTLTELAHCGVPAILIPYPHAADNHQVANAQSFVNQEAAIVVSEVDREDLANNLSTELEARLTNMRRIDEMSQNMKSLARPKATEEVANAIDSLCESVQPKTRWANAS